MSMNKFKLSVTCATADPYINIIVHVTSIIMSMNKFKAL